MRNCLILLFAIILFLVGGLSHGLTANAGIIMKFSDMNKQHSAYSSALYVTSMDYMNVFKDAKFKPKKAVTKAEAAKFVGKASNINSKKKSSDSITFKDVPKKSANYPYIIALTSIDAFEKKSKFHPKNAITKQEAAKLLVTAFNIPLKTGKEYVDVAEKNSYSDYISTAASYNILKGNPSKKFKPTQNLNRAAFAKALKKALDVRETIDDNAPKEIDSVQDSPNHNVVGTIIKKHDEKCQKVFRLRLRGTF